MSDNFNDGACAISPKRMLALAAAVLSVLMLAGCAGKNETADFDEAVDYEYYSEEEAETEPTLGSSETVTEAVTEILEDETVDSETVSAEKAASSQTEAVTEISAETTVSTAPAVTETSPQTPAETTVPATTAAHASEVVTDCSVPMAEVPVTTAAPTDYDSEFFSEDLFIGDSISTGYSLYGFLNDRNVFAKVGLNPSTVLTKTVSTCFGDIGISDMLTYTTPKRVYIMLGSNGIQWLSVDNMLKSTDTLVTLIKTACPDTEVMIISVPPVTPEYAATVKDIDVMAKINEYNDSLSDYCTENDMLFVDAASVLKSSTGYFNYSYAESDGMHFKSSAYRTLLSKIQADVTAFDETKAEEAEKEAETAVSDEAEVTTAPEETEETSAAAEETTSTSADEKKPAASSKKSASDSKTGGKSSDTKTSETKKK